MILVKYNQLKSGNYGHSLMIPRADKFNEWFSLIKM